MSVSKPLNARKEVRVHCTITVQFRASCENNYGTCWNLSKHGMYIVFDGEICSGEEIDLSFIISDEYPSLIELVGKVAWVNIGSNRKDMDRPEGFGVEFHDIDDNSISIIERFVQQS